jgi:hypothetical protein
MAITKIGTKLIGDGTITTVKLGSSAVTRTDIQSGSVQVTHLDVNQGAGTHVDFLDDDFLIAGDATSNGARGFSFSQLKTALSLSNAARGDEGTIQYNNGTGFDGIAKIRTDGIHLTASDAGKVVLAFTGISGSTGELYADSADGLTIEAKTRLSLHSSGAVQGNQSGSIELRADGLFPSVKPAVGAVAGTYVINLTSGSTGANGNKTYGPVNNTSQLIQAVGTGSSDFMFFLSNGISTTAPSGQSVNFSGTAQEFRVEAVSGISDWRDVAQNFFNKMKAQLETNTSIATVTFNAAPSLNGTASITVAYDSIAGGILVGTGRNEGGGSSLNGLVAAPEEEGRFNASTSNSSGPPIQKGFTYYASPSDQPAHEGGFVSTTTSGSAALDENLTWLNLGAFSRKYNEVHSTVISGSGTSQLHKVDADEVTANRVVQSRVGSELSGSGTATLHNLDVNEGTFGGVKFSSIRDAAAFALSGSGTANIHAVDIDLGTIDRVSALVVTGSGTSELHKVDSDLGTIDRVESLVVSGSGTSLFHKLTVDEGTHSRVATTAISGSGLVEFHNITAGDVSGSIAEFHKVNADLVNARVINSDVTTTENLEIDVKQLIPAVSQSAGAAQEGAGLQIGGTAGSGSAGIASVILGDAGSGAGADLLFKIGSTQGASLSGSISEGGQRFGVSGSISGSIGVFHEITVNQGLGAQDSIFSGSSFTGHLLSGSTAQAHFLDADEAQVADISGSAMTYNVITGSEANAHVVDADTATLADIDGTTLTYATVSGSTLTVNLANADRLEGNDVDVSGQISGSATSTLHKLTSNDVSGSHIEVHELGAASSYSDYIDNLVVKDLQGNDVIKKASLNNDIVKNDSGIHGGIVFNSGQLSVGFKRRIFSRSSKAIVNRTQPTQGSGSLYTTCSLGETQMVSGSESVFFNGLLLTRGNGVAGNPRDADYTIDYSHGGGLQTGTYRFLFTSGGVGQESTSGKAKAYSPLKQYIPQLVAVQSTGSSGKEYYFFYFNEAADPSPLPISASLNMEYSVLAPGAFRKTTAVEAVSGVSDWRDVVSNLATAMNTELNTNADLATVSYNATSSINGTASIEITYKAGTAEGGIFVGAAAGHAAKTAQIPGLSWTPSYTFGAIESAGVSGDGTNIPGEPDTAGATVQTVVSGNTEQVGTGVFLHEGLAMDSDDVLVVQYLSGSHQFG